jgi:hypothetical protein
LLGLKDQHPGLFENIAWGPAPFSNKPSKTQAVGPSHRASTNFGRHRRRGQSAAPVQILVNLFLDTSPWFYTVLVSRECKASRKGRVSRE